MHGTIVCGVDGTPEARAAAQLASALAARLRLRLVLVHVVEPQHDEADLDAIREEAAAGLDEVEIRLVHGNRVDELARVAADEGADAIVLGSRPHGPLGRQLHCPLARRLEAAQSVPVLIAPPGTRTRSARRLGLAEAGAGR